MEKRSDIETLLGEPVGAIKALAIPLLVSYLIIQVNLYVDTFWTSGLGSEPSSAISTIAPIYSIITTIGAALGVGATTTIAFRLGKGDGDRASLLAGNSLVLGILAGFLLSGMLIVLYNPLIDFIGAGDVRDLGWDYLKPYILMSWAVVSNNIVAALLRAEGAGRKSMVVLISSAAVNMILDPLLIYTLDLGVTGAGFATTISALAPALIGLYWYVGGKMVVKITRPSLKPR